MEETTSRLLRGFGGQGTSSEGPTIILILICLLFFLILAPVFCRRRCPAHFRCCNRNDEQSEAERQAEIIRVALENLRRLGFAHLALSQNNASRWMTTGGALQSLSPEDRREFLQNVLVSKKVVKVMKDGDDNDTFLEDQMAVKSSTRKTSLLLVDPMDIQITTKLVNVEPCSICLNEYSEDEILCWSQNSRCQHCFHRDCAIEWLMNREECPLCRNNYLSLDDDEGDEGRESGDRPLHRSSMSNSRSSSSLRTQDAAGNEDTSSFFRGMHLIYMLNQFQSSAGTPTDPTMPLEAIELPETRRDNVEMHESEEGGVGDVTNPSVNER